MHSSLTTIARKSASVAAMLGIAASGFLSLGGASLAQASAPNWNTTGNYTIAMEYQGTLYDHTMSLSQDGSGNLTGSGASSPYVWVIDSGTVSGDAFDITAHYTATADASTTVLHLMGTIAGDGTLSGTWSDNYPGTSTTTTRTGALTTVSGAATEIPVTPTLASPTPLTPSNGSATTTAGQTSVTWTAVTSGAGGVTYTYQTSSTTAANSDGSFTTPTFTSGPLATTSIATPGLGAGTYYWHVMATDASSTMSAWSTPWSFIVDNGTSTGTIGGTVGGHGTLMVTSVDAVDTSAIADGSFSDGWKYVFHITAPDNETNLAMKFSDWLMSTGSSTIPVAGNMRISSSQAASTTPVVLTAAGTYSSPDLHITGDLDPTTDGNQVTVTVEVAVPSGTANGSYTTSYGVRTLP